MLGWRGVWRSGRERISMRFRRTWIILVAALSVLGAATSHVQPTACSEGPELDCPDQSVGTTTNLPDVSARPPWTLLSRNDDAEGGYVLQKRKLDGSDFSTFRLEAILDSPPDLVALVAAKNLADPDYHEENTDKKVLRNDAEAIIVYSYIHITAPFVSDRDVISRIERSYDPETRIHRLSWKAIDEGPPKKKGVVRLDHSEGSWTFSPEAEGKTRAVYVSHTEIAGYVPAWIVNATMSKTMVQGIKSLRKAVHRERQADREN